MTNAAYPFERHCKPDLEYGDAVHKYSDPKVLADRILDVRAAYRIFGWDVAGTGNSSVLNCLTCGHKSGLITVKEGMFS